PHLRRLPFVTTGVTERPRRLSWARPMPRQARPYAAALTAALALAIVPAAHAAYAPKLAVTVKPTTAKAPIELISTVTQDASEEASQKVVVSFPVGLTF